MPRRAEGKGRAVSLLVCDDHRLVSEALAMAAGRSDTVRLVAAVERPSDAINICEKRRPDVVLIDGHLDAESSWSQATRQIKSVSPTTRVLIMNPDQSDRRIVEAIEAGVDGFVSKKQTVDQILRVVESAGRGDPLVDPKAISPLLQRAAHERHAREEIERRKAQLTNREREILDFLQQGLGNHSIATQLYISPRTVETHIQSILRKLQVHTKLEAVALVSGRRSSA